MNQRLCWSDNQLRHSKRSILLANVITPLRSIKALISFPQKFVPRDAFSTLHWRASRKSSHECWWFAESFTIAFVRIFNARRSIVSSLWLLHLSMKALIFASTFQFRLSVEFGPSQNSIDRRNFRRRNFLLRLSAWEHSKRVMTTWKPFASINLNP